ncbi:MAG: DUF1049 domain-containing protein [Proteobacteria bacterium]|nr:DUF1049 domain-containing protein [Pseudomonadota bacterium]
MRLLSWIILLPVALAVIAFSAANREPVALDLWPLPFTAEPPVFLIILLAVFAGFVWGGLVVWISAARRRRRAIAERLAGAEREVEQLKERLREKRLEGP